MMTRAGVVVALVGLAGCAGGKTRSADDLPTYPVVVSEEAVLSRLNADELRFQPLDGRAPVLTGRVYVSFTAGGEPMFLHETPAAGTATQNGATAPEALPTAPGASGAAAWEGWRGGHERPAWMRSVPPVPLAP